MLKQYYEKLTNHISQNFKLWILMFILILVYHPKWINWFYSKCNLHLNYVINVYSWSRWNEYNAEKIELGSYESLSKSGFNSNLKTYILVHGWTKNGTENWILNLKDALLWRESCNVLSIEWDSGSLTAGYYVIHARVPDVGNDIAAILKYLHKMTGLQYTNVHLIGHSLGAHISGFAGKALDGKIGRITGLDPASLSFNGKRESARLDRDDAEFVDIIHTNACYTIVNQLMDCFGSYDNIGDADFWPNGGEKQPACYESGNGVGFVEEGSNCDHAMACAYYTQSVYFYPSTTRFLSRKFDTYEEFNNASFGCDDIPQYMGHNADPSLHGVFYLNTSQHMPYALLVPHCSAATWSKFKIFGVLLCLVLIGDLILKVLSRISKKDLHELLKSEAEITLQKMKVRHSPNGKTK